MADDVIVFKRDEFYMLMGELALPPGSLAPSNTPCAPLAQRIVERTDEIELKDVIVGFPQERSERLNMEVVDEYIKNQVKEDGYMQMPETKDQRIVRECEQSGEPYIVFRGKDILSTMILRTYEDLLIQYTMTHYRTEIQEALETRLNEFIAWQQENPDRVKLPD